MMMNLYRKNVAQRNFFGSTSPTNKNLHTSTTAMEHCHMQKKFFSCPKVTTKFKFILLHGNKELSLCFKISEWK